MVGPVGKSPEVNPTASTSAANQQQEREKTAKEQPLLNDGAKVEAKTGHVPAKGAFEKLGKAADDMMEAAVDAASSGLDSVANAGKQVLQKIKEKPWILTPPGALYEIFQSKADERKKAQEAVKNIINQLKDPKVLERSGIGKPLTLETLNPEANKKLQDAIDKAVKKLTEELKNKPPQAAADAAKAAAELTLLTVAPAIGLTAAAARKLAEVVAKQEKQ